MNNGKVSVIIPVYNVEGYLNRCVDSVLDQSYQNIEVILVDDGSTDNSGQICDVYAEKFNNIYVVHQKNQGVSVARNVGISLAKGEWIVFVDSDDYILPGYIEKMVASQRQFNSDWVFCGCVFHQSGIDTESNVKFQEGSGFISSEKMQEFVSTWYKESHIAPPWGKMYCAEILKKNTLNFAVGVSYGEDTMFNVEYGKYCNCVSLVKDALYVYIKRDGSLSSVGLDAHENLPEALYQSFCSLCEFKGYPKKVADTFFVRGILSKLYFGINVGNNRTQWIEMCKKIAKDNRIFQVDITKMRIGSFPKMVVNLLKHNHFFLLWLVFKTKEFVRNHMRPVYVHLKK